MDDLDQLKSDLQKMNEDVYPDAGAMLRSLLNDVRRVYNDLEGMEMEDVQFELGEILRDYGEARVR